MRPEPLAIRSIWMLVMAAALAALALSVFRLPAPGRGMPYVASPHVTLWVPDTQTDPQSDLVAEQISGYWQLGDSAATVGVLPGHASTAVVRFLRSGRSVRQARENLLVLTSTTLSDVTGGSGDGSSLVANAPVIAVLASDPLELAVSASSPIRTTAQLLSVLRAEPDRRLFGLADDSWVKDNFAALVAFWRLQERRSYTAFDTTTDAVAGVEQGTAAVVLAPRSALEHGLRSGQLRVLRWPAGTPPVAWVALAAPVGLPAADVAKLRTEARRIARKPGWRRLLRSDGLTPLHPSAAALRAFLRHGTAHAAQLAALERRVIVH